MKTFDNRHLSGESVSSDSVSSLIEPYYDYVLLGSSWDRRCLSVTSASVQANVVQLLMPVNRGWSGVRERHDEALLDYCQKSAQHVDVIEEASENLESIFDRIEGTILELRKSSDGPLSMLVDLSAIPRYFSLGAIALGLNDGIATIVDVLYAEAQYGESYGQSVVDVPEHHGLWEAVAVPRLEGDWYPSNGRHFLVSVGFESTKVARLAERWDPDVISVLFPRPGVSKDYEERALSANAPWLRQFEVPPDRVVDCSPSDAIAAWETLSTELAIDPALENVYCLLCGPKPHALGMALYAMARVRPAVMYVRPTVHEEKDIQPNGTFWRYRLRDRTLLHSVVAPG